MNSLSYIVKFLSSLKLATVLLVLLGVLTWFATLEQIDSGLYQTLEKYFSWQRVVILPEINGKIVPLPLPNGYWVSALLTLNLIVGGLIKIRKGKKQIGVIIAHFGIIFMMIAGGVAHHYSKRGNMAIDQGKTSDVVESYTDFDLEITEMKDGKVHQVTVISDQWFQDLKHDQARLFRLPNLPFDLEIAGYYANAVPVSISEIAPQQGQLIVDSYWLLEKKKEVQAEANQAACHARIINRNGKKELPILVPAASYHPYTYQLGDRIFTIKMRKSLWVMPFALTLDHFDATFHPGTMKPKSFVSKVTRRENGSDAQVTIQMNEPMRYEGLTFFQASYGPTDAKPGDKLYSVFEVVKNPADRWPEYSLYIVMAGLLFHFVSQLIPHLKSRSAKKA